LLSLGITEGMKVAIPTHCCPSVLYAVRYVGATPILFDCGTLGYGSAPNAVADVAPLVKAVVVVHQYGIPDIYGVSQRLSIPLIEDCAAALGARIGTDLVGNFGILAIFSFFATKLIAGGECGAVAGDSDLIDWIRTRRTPRGADSACTHYPYSPSEVCSAIALTQLEQHQRFIDARTRLADTYSTEL
jgi:perosamine synthetase